MKRSRGEAAFDVCLNVFMALLILVMIYPFWTVIAMSFNDANDTARGGVILFPRKFTLLNFKTVFENEQLFNSYLITIARTIVGTVSSVTMMSLFAYGISKKKLMFRRLYFTLCIITMFFGGGMIASTINIRNLGLGNSFLVYIIPGLYNIMHIIIIKSFFISLPPALEEAALIDGANDARVFFHIVLPSAAPVLSTIALMTAVGQWNSWFDAYLFITDKRLMPLQFILQRIILGSNAASEISQFVPSDSVLSRSITPYSIQLATLVVTVGPIILIYPFFQRYFAKGMLIGAIKE